MNPEDVVECSYKGAVWKMSVSAITGGRKDAKHRIALSDRQIIEDLGLTPRSFRIDGTVAARHDTTGTITQSYETVRDALLRALESGGPGEFVHPYYGTISNVHARTFELTESSRNLGDGKITITFEISLGDGRPVALEHKAEAVLAANELLQACLTELLADLYESPVGDSTNFTDAIEQQDTFIDKANALATALPALTDKINAFTETVRDYKSQTVALVQAPLTLAAQVDGLMTAVNALYVEAFDSVTGAATSPSLASDQFKRTFETMKGFFDQGLDDVFFPNDTVSRQKRRKNRDAFNNFVRLSSLGYAYENAVQASYATVAEIDDVQEVLEDQYLAIRDVTEPSVRAELDLVRLEAVLFFDESKETARRTTTVETKAISTRLLAYSLYGASALGDDIARLNLLNDSARVEGTVSVFTGGELDAA